MPAIFLPSLPCPPLFGPWRFSASTGFHSSPSTQRAATAPYRPSGRAVRPSGSLRSVRTADGRGAPPSMELRLASRVTGPNGPNLRAPVSCVSSGASGSNTVNRETTGGHTPSCDFASVFGHFLPTPSQISNPDCRDNGHPIQPLHKCIWQDGEIAVSAKLRRVLHSDPRSEWTRNWMGFPKISQ